MVEKLRFHARVLNPVKFFNALTAGNYTAEFVSEKWLNDNITDSELLLAEYDVRRSDRPTGQESAHGGSLSRDKFRFVHPKKCWSSRKLFSLSNQDELQTHFVFNLYDPPKCSQYLYTISDFEKILSAIPNKQDA